MSCFATIVRHMGPVGSGHAAKLISNYLVIGMIALVAEAFGTARRAEIDWRDLYEGMLNGSGNSGVLRKMVASALDEDFEGYRFSLANASKDIGYFKSLQRISTWIRPWLRQSKRCFPLQWMKAWAR